MSLFEDQNLLNYIDAAQQKWAIPAVSVTIIDLNKGQSETKGFGHPTSGSVDENSIWSVCSNTKLFTVFALAILVEEGKLSWNSKLCDLIPELDLQDSHASETLTLEDVISHRSGIPSNGDAECTRHGKPSDIVTILSNVRPTLPTLKEFQYNNGFFSLAGYLVSRLSGKPFSSFVEEKILVPLGMTSSSFGQPVDKARSVTPCATVAGLGSQDVGPGFQDLEGEHIAFPAGGLLASGKDMAIWLGYLLRLSRDECGPNDPSIIKSATFKEMLRGRSLAVQQIGGIPTAVGQALFPEFSPPVYALGLYRCHYRGMDMAYHWGCGTGGGSVVLFVPQENIALAVFSNVERGAFTVAPAIALGALDHLFKLNRIDWVERIYNLPTGRNDAASQPPSKTSDMALSTGSEVVGTYNNTAFGDLHIFPLDIDPDVLSKHARETLQMLKEATSFGPSYTGKLDYIGVYENDPLFTSYFAIVHIEGPTHWAGVHGLSRVRNRGGEDIFVDIAESVALYDGAGQLRLDFIDGKHLELYDAYVPGVVAVGKGDATFIKRVSKLG